MNDFLIGGLAGIVSRTATAPIELFKLQRQNNYLKGNTIRQVIKNEGIRHLWKGNMTNCIRVFPQYATNFAIFENSKNYYNRYFENKDFVNFLAGGSGGVVSMCSIYPLETARTHLSLQQNKSNYKNLFDVFKKLKFRQLYSGLKMSMMGFGPWNAINFMSYHKYKEIFKDYENNKNMYKLLCGGFSGITALTVTYPSDLIRKRLQMQSFSSEVPKYNGIVDCTRKICQTDGFLGLYRGLYVGYIKCFPTLAIQFWAYDTLKEYFT